MAKRPNVLLVTTDHWPAALLGCAGHPAIQTPTLDALAGAGIRYTNAYSECPVCIPARRTLMTGTSPRTHGDRVFSERMPMPDLPTLAGTFRAAGYQANAVGKLHVYPQRDRIGFDDVVLDEEGRTQYGVTDDYELFLGDEGFAGRQFGHGMSNNRYVSRPWHLPEHTHATNWATSAMVRTIKRRDPTRPAFWYLAYRHPHPPLVPLTAYLDLYREPVDAPFERHAGSRRTPRAPGTDPGAAALRRRPGVGARRQTRWRRRPHLPPGRQQGAQRPARRALAAGAAARTYGPADNKALSGQRGGHWPPPPRTDMEQIRWLTGSA